MYLGTDFKYVGTDFKLAPLAPLALLTEATDYLRFSFHGCAICYVSFGVTLYTYY